jgi:hypothetical protein
MCMDCHGTRVIPIDIGILRSVVLFIAVDLQLSIKVFRIEINPSVRKTFIESCRSIRLSQKLLLRAAGQSVCPKNFYWELQINSSVPKTFIESCRSIRLSQKLLLRAAGHSVCPKNFYWELQVTPSVPKTFIESCRSTAILVINMYMVSGLNHVPFLPRFTIK